MTKFVFLSLFNLISISNHHHWINPQETGRQRLPASTSTSLSILSLVCSYVKLELMFYKIFLCLAVFSLDLEAVHPASYCRKYHSIPIPSLSSITQYQPDYSWQCLRRNQCECDCRSVWAHRLFSGASLWKPAINETVHHHSSLWTWQQQMGELVWFVKFISVGYLSSLWAW